MDEVVSVHAAKTHLSRLLARVEAREKIIIARRKTAVVKLIPIATKGKREFGAMRGKISIGPEFSIPCRPMSWTAGTNSGCTCCWTRTR